jgi:hypothetical protein
MNIPQPPTSYEPLRFNNAAKLLKQMRKRGWSEEMIREALQTVPEMWQGKLGPAWRYTHAESGQKLLVDAATLEIFHLGGRRYKYDSR